MLLLRGANVNANEPAQNQTAAMWAAAERHTRVLRTLVEANADLKAHTKTGFTPLHFAARVGDIETARMLLDAGVDVNIRYARDAESGRGRGAAEAGAGGIAAAA